MKTLIAVRSQRLKHIKQLNNAKTTAIFLSPALLFFLVFIIYPVITSLVYSFFNIQIVGTTVKYSFVAFNNFIGVFKDSVFWKSATNTLIWGFTSPFLEIPIALLLALYLKKGTKLTKGLRVLWFTPVLLPQVVVGIIWAWIYNSDWGLLNKILSMMHLESFTTAWLGNPKTALLSLILVTTWTWIGFNMIILLASVSSIPGELLEAAKIDGAKGYQVLFKIIIPLIRPVLINLMILCFIGKMKVFDLIWVTTQGGPMWATETVATYTVKRAFYWATFDKGYPSAIATIWFVMILTISVVTTLTLQKKDAKQ